MQKRMKENRPSPRNCMPQGIKAATRRCRSCNTAGLRGWAGICLRRRDLIFDIPRNLAGGQYLFIQLAFCFRGKLEHALAKVIAGVKGAVALRDEHTMFLVCLAGKSRSSIDRKQKETKGHGRTVAAVSPCPDYSLKIPTASKTINTATKPSRAYTTRMMIVNCRVDNLT